MKLKMTKAIKRACKTRTISAHTLFTRKLDSIPLPFQQTFNRFPVTPLDNHHAIFNRATGSAVLF